MNSLTKHPSLQQVRLLREGQKILNKQSLAQLQTLISNNVRERKDVPAQELAELKLQGLIKEGASFKEMRPVLNSLYEQDKSLTLQARLVELAVQHGDNSDVTSMLTFLAQVGEDFYPLIKPETRCKLVYTFWQKTTSSPLKDLLSVHKNHPQLTDEERLYVFDLLRHLRIVSEMLVYFEQHQESILTAARRRQLDINELFLLLGKASLQLSYLDGCRHYLHKINRKSHAYRTALQILLIPPAKDSSNRVLKCILAEHKWENRLTLLDNCLIQASRKNPLTDSDRPALNAVLAEVLKLIPRQSEAWLQLSNVLVRHYQQEDSYPNLFRVFRQHRYIFHAGGLDTALWHGFLQHKDKHLIHWIGFAHLHHYISSGSSAEKSLWRAKLLLEQEENGELWRKAHSAALAFVRNTDAIPTGQQQRMLPQLLVSCLPADLLMSDVRSYLPTCTSRFVLATLEAVVRNKNEHDLEITTICQRATLAHFRNQDLNRLWLIARDKEYYDFAWRIASVLNARCALLPLVRNAWQISGEKRAQYPLQSVSAQTVDVCTVGFREHERKFLTAFFSIGAIIPSLFARLDNKAKIYRRPLPKDPQQRKIEVYLRSLAWLTPTKKTYYFSYDGLLSRNQQLPLFVKNVPHSVWSILFLQLAEKLSLNHWSWQLSTLMKNIDKVLPRFVTRSAITARAVSWLTYQPAERRNAWHVFVSQARKISDNRAEELLGSFLCRLATCIYQNHYQALLSLQLMQTPLTFIWNLEKFILCAEYHQLRKEQDCLHRVTIPHSIINMSNITGADTC